MSRKQEKKRFVTLACILMSGVTAFCMGQVLATNNPMMRVLWFVASLAAANLLLGLLKKGPKM